MREYKTEKVTSEVRKLVKLTCDLCGTEPKMIANAWAPGYYDDSEVTVEIRHRQGTAYPEGSSGTDYTFDMCPKCFHEKLIPWMQSQGAKLRETDYEF